MKFKRKPIAALGALAGVGVAITAACFIPQPSTSADFAAWAQGIGTIVAVGVAAWVGLLPARHEEMRRKRALENFLHALGGAVYYEEVSSRRDFRNIREETSRDTLCLCVLFFDTAGPRRTLTAILKEPYPTWPSPELYVAALRLDDAWTELTRSVAGAVEASKRIVEGDIGAPGTPPEEGFDLSIVGLKMDLDEVERARIHLRRAIANTRVDLSLAHVSTHF